MATSHDRQLLSRGSNVVRDSRTTTPTHFHTSFDITNLLNDLRVEDANEICVFSLTPSGEETALLGYLPLECIGCLRAVENRISIIQASVDSKETSWTLASAPFR